MTSAASEPGAPLAEPGSRILDAVADPEAAFAAAERAVAAGEVIVLPTDTVYGIAADATSPAAVQRLLDAKRRGRDMPPPVLLAEPEAVAALAASVDDRVRELAAAFWPGPLTLVVASAPSLRMDLGERGATIAVRVPDHDFTRELLRRTGPLAVSSANINGRDAALTVADAVEQLGDAVAVYLDAGATPGPTPSTIVDLSSNVPALLRPGRVSVTALNAVVDGLIPVAPEPASDEDAPAAEAPEGDAAPPEPAEAEAEAEAAQLEDAG